MNGPFHLYNHDLYKVKGLSLYSESTSSSDDEVHINHFSLNYFKQNMRTVKMTE